jgi:Luciferase-like monooxygenase
MRWRTPRWSPGCRSRQRTPDGTASFSGITSAGGSRFWRSPMPGSRWRRSPPPRRSDSARWSPRSPGADRSRWPGDRDPGSAGRRPLAARRRPGQRPVRERAFDHWGGTRDRRRAGMLDEALEILTAAWSGGPVDHRGEHDRVDGMWFLPRPVQRPGSRWGWAGTPESESRFGVPPGSRGASRSTRAPQTSSPSSSLSSPRSEARSGGTQRSPSTWSRRCRWPPIRRPGSAGATWWMVESRWTGVSVDQLGGVIGDRPAPSG